MGMLFRMFAPKPLKKARKLAHPVSLATPRPAKRARMTVVNAANPPGAAKRAAKTAAVRAVRSTPPRAGRLSAHPTRRAAAVVAAGPAIGGLGTGVAQMQFKTDQHREQYERVHGWLAELFGEAVKANADEPVLRVAWGPETVFVHFVTNDEGGVLLNLRTWPLDRLKVPDAALRRMLEINAGSPIGDLLIEGLGEAEYSYTALTENLTKETLDYLFRAFAFYANEARAELRQFTT
jgi:hypothetical protein